MTTKKIVLAQASFDVVPTERGGAVFIDANRFPEGQLTHELNSRGTYSEGLGRLLRAKLDGAQTNRLHLMENRSWAHAGGLTFGPMYAIGEELILRNAVQAQQMDITLTMGKGMKGIMAQDGTLKYNGEPVTAFNYADFEIMRTKSEILPDLLALKNMFRFGGADIIENGFINLPSAAHLPPQLPAQLKDRLAGSFMRKALIYDSFDSNGIATPARMVVNLAQQTQSETLASIREMVKEYGTVVIKTNEAGGRSVGVFVVNDAAQAGNVFRAMQEHMRRHNIASWLIEQRQAGITVSACGKKWLVELTPLVVGERSLGESTVSVMAKYIQVGRRNTEGYELLPGMLPSYAYLGLNDGGVVSAGKTMLDSIISNNDLLTLRRTLETVTMGTVEQQINAHFTENHDEAKAIKEELNGSGITERVAKEAEKAKMALESAVDTSMGRLKNAMAALSPNDLKDMLR